MLLLHQHSGKGDAAQPEACAKADRMRGERQQAQQEVRLEQLVVPVAQLVEQPV